MSATAPDEPRAPLLDIRLFGTFELRREGALLRPALRSRKAGWLLALLILYHDRPPRERDWLAGLLWPDSSPSLALYSLRRRLTDLRRALGAEAHRVLSPTPHTLRLDLCGMACDLLAFDAALRRGDPASLEEAVALYRGPLLDGCPEPWIIPEREAREQAYLEALEAFARAATAAGDPREAARLLRRAVLADPLRESAQRGLMRALAEDGDFAAATQVYRDLRVYLHRELNAEPDPETTALFRQIREAATARAHARGPVRLNSRVSNALPPRLPPRFTRFFGREQEIARLQRLLSPTPSVSSPPRLLTLTGPGGSGKTRLAIEAAEGLKESLDGDIWFVPLATLLADARLIPGAIVEALGLPRAPNPEPLEQVIGFLSGRRGPALLILDNFEHLVAPGGALIVRSLLERVPLLTCLVTARQVLSLEGEREFPVLPLPTPSEAGVGEQPRPNPGAHETLLAYPSVALFVDRAQARRPDFTLTPRDEAAVAELCRRLEGIPLAIELAASWARTLTPPQMVSRLEHRFAFLVSHRADLPPRHLSLHAALDWSYRLLSPELRRLFARLSVFRGGWTAEASGAVCEESLALAEEHLARLAECSLILTEERAGEMRFRMLETLREFGSEQLNEEERAQVRRRHLRFYQTLAEEAETHRKGPERAAWLDRLERESDNLRASLAWCREDADGAVAGLRLAGSLCWFWDVRGYLSEGRECLRIALAKEGTTGCPTERAKALIHAGWMARFQADFAAARSCHKESLAIYRQLADQQGIALALTHLGTLAAEEDDYATADELFCTTFALHREAGNRRMMADSLGKRGLLAALQGDYEAARALHQQSLAIERDLENRSGAAVSLYDLGNVARWQNDYSHAQALYEEALATIGDSGDLTWQALILSSLGETAFRRGDNGSARSLCEKSIEILQELGDKPHLAFALANLGNVALSQGDDGLSLALFRRSLAMGREVSDVGAIARALDGLGSVASMRQQSGRQARLWGAMEALRATIGTPLMPERRFDWDYDWNPDGTAGRASAGDAAFTSAWAEGRAMTLEQAVAYALCDENEGRGHALDEPKPYPTV